MIATLMLIALCSCTSTATKGPTITNSAFGPNKARWPQQIKSRPIFKKKPGNAVADFQKDNRGGRLKLKQYGAPGSLTPYYNKLLTEDLGIKIEVIADGLIKPDLLRYAKHYNALMTIEIERKYGPGILSQARYRASLIKAAIEKSARQ